MFILYSKALDVGLDITSSGLECAGLFQRKASPAIVEQMHCSARGRAEGVDLHKAPLHALACIADDGGACSAAERGWEWR
jgi:hypothetical protein